MHRLAVRVIEDAARHAGQTDILRELLDGAVGLDRTTPNLPVGNDWPRLRAALTELAERY